MENCTQISGNRQGCIMPGKDAKGKAGKKEGQQFARLAVGYLERIRRLRQNGPKAMLVLAWLLIRAAGRETAEISLKKLVDLTGITKPSVLIALRDLAELNLIEIGSGINRYGNKINLYRILPPPPSQESLQGRSKNLTTPVKNLDRPVQNSLPPCTKIFTTPIQKSLPLYRIDNNSIDDIDIIDGEKSIDKTCFEKIVEALAAIGVGQNMRYKLAVKAHDAGLSDEDIANAGKLAAVQVLGKKTRNAEGLDFTRGLNKAALESIGGYAIGIIENTIEQGTAEIPGP